MYAVIKTGGKQYRVTEGQTLKVEKLSESIGTSVKFKNVLLVGEGNKLHVGYPEVEGAEVRVKIIDHGRASKINIIKFKRRKHHMKRMGHRQNFTAVKVTSISIGKKEGI